jgi:hypothetical protein
MYILLACLVAVAKDLHMFWTRGAQYAVVQTCTDNEVPVGSHIELVSNCLYPTPEYEVGCVNRKLKDVRVFRRTRPQCKVLAACLAERWLTVGLLYLQHGCVSCR